MEGSHSYWALPGPCTIEVGFYRPQYPYPPVYVWLLYSGHEFSMTFAALPGHAYEIAGFNWVGSWSFWVKDLDSGDVVAEIDVPWYVPSANAACILQQLKPPPELGEP